MDKTNKVKKYYERFNEYSSIYYYGYWYYYRKIFCKELLKYVKYNRKNNINILDLGGGATKSTVYFRY